MKKVILIATGLGISFISFGQKQNIQSANNALREKDYPKALEYINTALNDPSTKDDPKAWFTKGKIYMEMQNDPAQKASKPYQEASKAFLKAVELKATYEKENIDNALLNAAYNYYNDAVVAYNAKELDNAYSFASSTIQIHDLEGGKRFNNKSFDTLTSQAKVIQAFSAYNNNKFDIAIPALQNLKNDPVSKTANVYLLLADVYRKQNNDAQYLAVLQEAKAAFPNDQNVRNEELNYYIRTGKQNELIAKLQEAVDKAPTNAEYAYNLAKAYYNVAFPKEGPKPANFSELVTKAESSFMNALKLAPENAGYNYETGVLYYNQATEINTQMNNIKGTSAAENKKYDDLKVQRDAMFAKATPYLEKSYSVLEPKMSSLTDDDKFVYQSSLLALKEIYVRQDKLDKSKQMKEKLDALK